jgi:hypothetical protein
MQRIAAVKEFVSRVAFVPAPGHPCTWPVEVSMARLRIMGGTASLASARNCIVALALGLTVLSALSAGARAGEWVERPFDPPVGSRWIIQSTVTKENDSDGHVQKQSVTTTAELVIEERVVEGFRISHVVRKVTYQADPDASALIEVIRKTLENLVVRATTAANGVPLRIDNLPEVHSAAQAAIADLTAPRAGTPEVAAALRQVARTMLLADERQAVKVYLPNLISLALGQNTGLSPGETRRIDNDEINPFGGTPIKSHTMLRIDQVEPDIGKVRYAAERSFDPDSVRALLGGLAQHFAAASKQALSVDSVLKQLAMTLEGRSEIDVEEGMTRAVRETDTVTVRVPGRSSVGRAYQQLTVARAPSGDAR